MVNTTKSIEPTPKMPPANLLLSKNMANLSKSIDSVNPATLPIMKAPGLKAMTLENWVTTTFSPQSTPSLSKFGLKNAQDVLAFLKSPAGKVLRGEVSAQLELQATLLEQQRFELREHNLLMHRIRALLFKWFCEDSEHASDKVKEQTQLQIDKTLSTHRANLESSSYKVDHKYTEQLQAAIANYDSSIKIISGLQNKNHIQAQHLDTQLNKLIELGAQIDYKYKVYAEHLSAIEQFLADNEPLEMSRIQDQVQIFTNQINELADQVNALLDHNKESEARALMEYQNGLNQQLGVLFDIIEVQNGTKYFANVEGEPVTSLQEAQFVLNIGQKIVQENGKHYLLKPGQNWDTITPTEKEQARQDFKHKKQELLQVKKVIQHHQGKETSAHEKRVEDTKEQIKQNKAEKLELDNQLNLVQAARADAQNLLKQNTLNPDVPKPTPTGGNANIPKPTQSSATQVFREKMIELRSHEQITPKELFALAAQAPAADKSSIKQYLDKNIAQMPQTKPIPKDKLDPLFKGMEALGFNFLTPKPSIAKTKKDIEEPTPSSPNPFSTKSTPFK